MDVFEYRDAVIADHTNFNTSLTKIKAPDTVSFDSQCYYAGEYWPAPLIQFTRQFAAGDKVQQLVAKCILHAEYAINFRFGCDEHARIGVSAQLHKHQHDAITIAHKLECYVLTTRTVPGKSLSYILPIVDKEGKSKVVDTKFSIKAIILDPMNALVNSQLEELEKFLGHCGNDKPVTGGRYTGQECSEECHAMAATPPDIILTNSMILVLLMTWQDELDRKVMQTAQSFKYHVLDALHTYRGRQGSGTGMLVRRVREALNFDVLCKKRGLREYFPIHRLFQGMELMETSWTFANTTLRPSC